MGGNVQHYSTNTQDGVPGNLMSVMQIYQDKLFALLDHACMMYLQVFHRRHGEVSSIDRARVMNLDTRIRTFLWEFSIDLEHERLRQKEEQ